MLIKKPRLDEETAYWAKCLPLPPVFAGLVSGASICRYPNLNLQVILGYGQAMYAEITNDSEVFVSLSNRHLLYFSFMLHVIYNFLSVLQMVFLWDTDRRSHLSLEHCQLYGRGKKENGDHWVLKCLLGSDAHCFCSHVIGQACQ